MPEGVATSSRPTRFLHAAIDASAFATRSVLCNGPGGDWLHAATTRMDTRAATSVGRRMSRRSSHERVLEFVRAKARPAAVNSWPGTWSSARSGIIRETGHGVL